MSGRPSMYPWGRWFKKKSKTILDPEEFSCTQRSMVVMVRTQARLHGVWVSVSRLKNGGIEFQVVGSR
jgi:hypothetical protein